MVLRVDGRCSLLQGCMEKVQAWLQDNLGVILGVCVGVAVIEVWLPPPRAVLLGCPCSADALGEAEAHRPPEAHRPLEALWQAWPEHCPSLALATWS